jgi:hypothetical protein
MKPSQAPCAFTRYEAFTGAPHYAASNDRLEVRAERHVCIEDDHIVNIFSFSKAFGMMVRALMVGCDLKGSTPS